MRNGLLLLIVGAAIAFILVKFVPAPTRATSAEMNGLRVLAAELEASEKQQGFHFANWAQVSTQLDLLRFNRAMSKDPSYRVEEHYDFVDESTPMTPTNVERLAIVQRDETNKIGFRRSRFVIVRSATSLEAREIAEDRVRRAMQTGQLPPPARLGLTLGPVIAGVLLAAAVGVLVFRVLAKRKRSI